MGFINTLRFIFNGTKSKSLIKEGWKIDYQYAHLTDFFDPIAMFSELNYKIIGVPAEARFQYNGSFPDGKGLWAQNQSMHLKISAMVSVLSLRLKINRYIKKVEDRPTTVYKIWYNEKPLAVWHKKYEFGRDYGIDIQNIFTLDAIGEEAFSKIENWENNSIMAHNGNNECCLIEKFVHTHVLIIHDIKTFVSLWGALQKNSN